MFECLCTRDYNLTNKSLTSLTYVDIDNDGDLDAFGVEMGMSAGKIFTSEVKK